jgi:hypothetical protein
MLHRFCVRKNLADIGILEGRNRVTGPFGPAEIGIIKYLTAADILGIRGIGDGHIVLAARCLIDKDLLKIVPFMENGRQSLINLFG